MESRDGVDRDGDRQGVLLLLTGVRVLQWCNDSPRDRDLVPRFPTGGVGGAQVTSDWSGHPPQPKLKVASEVFISHVPPGASPPTTAHGRWVGGWGG